jgi:hypothetical protein
MSELGSQLVSETGQDGLTIRLGETKPVLCRTFCSIFLLDGFRTQPNLVVGHIPGHNFILFTGLVTGTILEHPGITV